MKTVSRLVTPTFDTINPKLLDTVTYAIRADINNADFGTQVMKQSLDGLKVDYHDVIVANAALVESSKYLPVAQIDKIVYNIKFRQMHRLDFSGNVGDPTDPGQHRWTHYFHLERRIEEAFGDPLATHCFSEAAIGSISITLGEIYGKKLGITLNSIQVGVTEASSCHKAVEAWSGYREMAAKLSSLERGAQSEEVAHIVSFAETPMSLEEAATQCLQMVGS